MASLNSNCRGAQDIHLSTFKMDSLRCVWVQLDRNRPGRKLRGWFVIGGVRFIHLDEFDPTHHGLKNMSDDPDRDGLMGHHDQEPKRNPAFTPIGPSKI
jgi:hypothetical protein